MTWDLILGDCLDPVTGLPALADGSIDVVITDPPYGICDDALKRSAGKAVEESARRSKVGKRLVSTANTWHPPSEWDHDIDPRWCAEVCRVSGVVIWFGHWRKRAEVESAMLHPIRAEIIWLKDMHTTPAQPVASQDERIWVFSAEPVNPREFSTSVWPCPVIPTWSHKHHKNEKPVALMEKLIRVFADPGALVVDPFAGSGTTGVAAAKLGRRFLGWEKKPEHHAAAIKRLAAAREQLVMFGGAA